MKKLEMRLQKGSMMVLFAVLLPIFVFFVSVVVDLARAQAHRSYLQNVADAAALAGVNTIEHTGMARVVPDCPGNAVPVPDKETNADLEARNSIRSNTGSENPFTNIAMELKSTGTETNGAYYYCVTIEDHVPLLLARVFLPDNILPDGIPVPPIVAWAMVNHEVDSVENNVYAKLDKIGKEQIVKDYKTLKKAFASVQGMGDASQRVERLGNNPSKYNLPNTRVYSISDSGISRTETVIAKNASTWKYLFVEFEPDIKIATTNGNHQDETYYFPFDNWDIGMDLGDQWNKIIYTGMKEIEGKSRTEAIRILSEALLGDDNSDEAKAKARANAEAILDTVIENVVSFRDASTVRGEIHKIDDRTEQGIEARRQALADWEDHGSFKPDLKRKEAMIARYTHNDRLGDLVARSVNGHISAYDPLLVKIESEDINKTPSDTSGDGKYFFASSTRKVTIKIDVDNTAAANRPLIIYYYGPEDFDGNTGNDQTGVKRNSRLVTLELNANFKGILFAPNSPVTIKANGHTIEGLVVAKSYCYANEAPLNYNGNIYSQFGFKSSDLTFNDFDMLDLSGGVYKPENVLITSEQAKHLK